MTNILENVDDPLHLLHRVVVEEAQSADAARQLHLLVHELHGVVVAVGAGHPRLVEPGGEDGGVLQPQPLHGGLAEVDGECWSSAHGVPAAVQSQLEGGRGELTEADQTGGYLVTVHQGLDATEEGGGESRLVTL